MFVRELKQKIGPRSDKILVVKGKNKSKVITLMVISILDTLSNSGYNIINSTS